MTDSFELFGVGASPLIHANDIRPEELVFSIHTNGPAHKEFDDINLSTTNFKTPADKKLFENFAKDLLASIPAETPINCLKLDVHVLGKSENNLTWASNVEIVKDFNFSKTGLIESITKSFDRSTPNYDLTVRFNCK